MQWCVDWRLFTEHAWSAKIYVRPVFSHNYGGHLLCVVHVRVIDGLVNKRLYTVYVQLVCSILLILHASGGCTLSHSYKTMLNC